MPQKSKSTAYILSLFFALVICLVCIQSPGFVQGLIGAPTHPPRNTDSEKATIPADQFQTSGIIKVVYPKANATIDGDKTFLIGQCESGGNLSCNGKEVKLSSDGYFAQTVDLKPGENIFNLSSTNADSKLSIKVLRPESPNDSDKGSFINPIEPKDDLGLMPGDTLKFLVRGTPNAKISANFGQGEINLQSQAWLIGNDPNARSNNGISTTDTATSYGRTTYSTSTNQPINGASIYSGFTKIKETPSVNKKSISYSAKFNTTPPSGSLLPSKNTITVLTSVFTGRTKNKATIVRTKPGLSRLTPLDKDIRLTIDGWSGDYYRCRMGANKHVFILKKDIELDQNTAYLPFSNLDTINLSETPEYTKIVLPLQQRLPYQIEQDVQANRMILRLYGAKSNIDWITEAPKKDQISTVDHITWNQVQDGVLEITAHLDVSQQWGYWCEYEDTKLNFYIRKAPKLPGTDLAMQGLTVCIDPGHGGEETGSIGPSGVHESTINLAIAQNLAKLLSDNGAKVILTRTTDDINPSLDERVKIAVSSKANILISVHNNALPDNRDPWAERGTSTYWYHPQAVKLAKLIRENVAQSTGFPDYGTYYQNLALCRPSELVSVLVEVGFMINPDEYAQLLKPETQQSAAQGIYNGIYSYLTLMH